MSSVVFLANIISNDLVQVLNRLISEFILQNKIEFKFIKQNLLSFHYNNDFIIYVNFSNLQNIKSL